jgi:hypothetical protein
MITQYEAINSFVCETKDRETFVINKGEVYAIPDYIADDLLIDGLVKPINVIWH